MNKLLLLLALSSMALFTQGQSIHYNWAKNVGGDKKDIGADIAGEPGKGYFVTGFFTDTADFDPSASTAQLSKPITGSYILVSYLAKYDNNGSYEWAVNFGKTSTRGLQVETDSANNVYAMGGLDGTADFDPSSASKTLTSAGAFDLYLAKYDENGKYLWANLISGTNNVIGEAMDIDQDNNIYITGYFYGTVDFDPSSATANLVSPSGAGGFIAKYDSLGNYLWAYSCDGLGDESQDIEVAENGDIYVAGYFSFTKDFDPSANTANLTSNGQDDVFLAKFDNNGNYKWAIGMGSIAYDEANTLAIDSNHNIYLAGYFRQTMDFDPSSKTANFVVPGQREGFLAKYDSSGNYLWAIEFGGPTTAEVHDLLINEKNNPVLTGYYSYYSDLNMSDTNGYVSSNGYEDVFIAEYNSSGNFHWVKNMGGSNGDFAHAILLNGNILAVTGEMEKTAYFDLAGNTGLTSLGAEDIFYAKYILDTAYSYNAPPNIPSYVKASLNSVTGVDLNWHDNSNNETGFAIARSDNKIQWTILDSVGADITTYNDQAALTIGQDYYYKIYAYSSEGNSSYSDFAIINYTESTDSLKLLSPNGGEQWTAGTTEYLLWSDLLPSGGQLEFYISYDGGNSWFWFTDAPTGNANPKDSIAVNVPAQISDSCLLAVIHYGGTLTDTSNTYFSIIAGNGQAPDAPDSLTVSLAGNLSLQLDWKDNSNNEDGFTIERSTDSINWSHLAQVGAGTTTYIDHTGLIHSQEYFYRVAAYNSIGSSAFSNVDSEVAVIIGLHSYLQNSVKIYPNPSSGYVIIEAPMSVEMKVYNLLGELLFSTTSHEVMLDVSDFPSGSYVVKVTDNKTSITKKLTVQ